MIHNILYKYICIDAKLLKKVRNNVYLRHIRMKVRTQNGIEGLLRRKPVMINQAEWNKEKTKKVKKKVENIVKPKRKVEKILKKAVLNKKVNKVKI